jgi:hypothetical protein
VSDERSNDRHDAFSDSRSSALKRSVADRSAHLPKTRPAGPAAADGDPQWAEMCVGALATDKNEEFTCALSADNTIWIFGFLPSDAYYSCGMKESSDSFCWRYEDYGQLDYGPPPPGAWASWDNRRKMGGEPEPETAKWIRRGAEAVSAPFLSFFLSMVYRLTCPTKGRSRLWAVEYGESPRLLGSGVWFLAVGYVGRIRAGVGFLAVVYVGRIRAGRWGA